MTHRFAVCVGLFLLLLSPGLYAQNQSLIIQWEIDGPQAPSGGARPPFDVPTAQSYTYKVYVVGAATGTTLTPVTCTTTNDPFVKTCSAPLPASHSAPGLSLDLTVTVGGVESSHSNAAVTPPVTVPPTTPRNTRILKAPGGPIAPIPAAPPK